MGQKALRIDDIVIKAPMAEFDTANGQVSSDRVATYWSEPMSEYVTAYRLDESVSVISIGKRCVTEGYAFHWLPGAAPFFVKPDGTHIPFEVENFVPFLTEPDNE
eukprot:500306-Heterocapsa_arctica.AAC.1